MFWSQVRNLISKIRLFFFFFSWNCFLLFLLLLLLISYFSVNFRHDIIGKVIGQYVQIMIKIFNKFVVCSGRSLEEWKGIKSKADFEIRNLKARASISNNSKINFGLLFLNTFLCNSKSCNMYTYIYPEENIRTVIQFCIFCVLVDS